MNSTIFKSVSKLLFRFKVSNKFPHPNRVVYRPIVADRKEYSDFDFSGVKQAFICFKYIRLIKAAIRENGPFPIKNKKLAAVLEMAEKKNIPPDYIDYAMDISVDLRANVGLYELIIPGNGHFIIQYEGIDCGATKQHLLKIVQTIDATLVHGDARWPQRFDQKGIILVNLKSCSNLTDMKSAEEAAIKSRAESVTRECDEEGVEYWKFCCNPSSLHEVKRHLRETTNHIEEAYTGYVSKSLLDSNHLKNIASNLILDLNKIPHIDKVYNNIKILE